MKIYPASHQNSQIYRLLIIRETRSEIDFINKRRGWYAEMSIEEAYLLSYKQTRGCLCKI